MVLTELEVRNAKSKDKPYYLSDRNGLLLFVKNDNRKYWICRARVHGKEVRRSIGVYPDVTLKQARLLCHDKVKELSSASGTVRPSMTFEQVASDYLDNVILPKCKPSYVRKIRQKLDCYILPCFGKGKIDCIKPVDVLELCKKQEKQEHFETSQQIREVVSQVYKYAISMGLVDSNPAQYINIALVKKPSRPHPVLPPEQFGMLVKALRLYPFRMARNAMLLLAYCFVRPSVVCTASWREIAFKDKLWVVPAHKMKTGKEHIVPLSHQAIEILNDQFEVTGGYDFVFPASRDFKRPMSVDSLRLVLRYIGYTGEQFNSYSFRPQASTMLNEWEFPVDVVELQLAHADKNVIRSIYNHAEHMSKRVAMMQWYADYVDSLATGSAPPQKLG